MVNSEYHRQQSDRARERRLAFAIAFNNLLRARVREGRSLHGIKLRAAAMAGFGNGSWSDKATYKTQRVKAAQMLKDPLVIEKLKELGLAPHSFKKNEWVIAGEVENGQKG